MGKATTTVYKRGKWFLQDTWVIWTGKNPHSEHYQTHRNIVYEMITPLGSLGALQETWIAVALIASTCGADRFAGTVK